MKKEERIILGILPQYTTPPTIYSDSHPLKIAPPFKINIDAEDFQFVHVGKSESIPIKGYVKNCDINVNLLEDRMVDGKNTGTTTFSRVK